MKKFTGMIIFMLSNPLRAEWKYSANVAPYFQKIGLETTTISPAEKAGISGNLNLEKKITPRVKFRSDIWVRTDFFARDAEEAFQYIPKNLYLQHRSILTTKFGFQTLQLDGPDLVNPADVVHSKNWIDPTAAVTQSSGGLSIAQEKSEWSWELLYVPRQTTLTLPGSHSPWLPRKNRLPIESEDTEIRIPDDVEYQYLGSKTLNDALNHNVTLKLKRSTETYEGQLLYYNGLSHSPFLLTRVSGSLVSVSPQIIEVDSTVKLIPLFYRHHVLAGTFNIPFDTWALHGGMNWQKPQGNDARIPGETTLFVLGVEKNLETNWGRIIGVFDYVRQKRQDEDQISFLRSILEEAVTGGVRIPVGEETQIFAGGLYDLAGSSSLLKGSVSHRMNANLSVELQGQLLAGTKDSLIGLYDRHNSFQLQLIWSW